MSPESFFQSPEMLHDINLLLLPTETPIAQGNLNTLVVVASPEGRRYLLRREVQEGRDAGIAHVRSELEGTGFLTNPDNGFSTRTPEEQRDFSESLRDSGTHTPIVYYAQGDLQVMEFIENATTVSDLWLSNDPRAFVATENAILAIMHTHHTGLVIGDRWGPNELVTSDDQIYLIDFDFGLWGPEAKEFDLVTFLFHIGYFAQKGSPESMPLLQDLYVSLLTHPVVDQIYSMDVLLRFMKQYGEFYATDKTKNSPLYCRWNDPEDTKSFFDTVGRRIL